LTISVHVHSISQVQLDIDLKDSKYFHMILKYVKN